MEERRKQPRISYELTDDQLDGVSGGVEVVKLGKITVEGKREPVKLDRVVVNEKRTKTS